MVKKIVFKHQTIYPCYKGSQPVKSDLIDRFESMGLAAFLQHRCDWSETIIHQLYATLEIDMIHETLDWMNGKRRYHATFADFATANELSYTFLKDEHSVNMMVENTLDENDYPAFYEPAHLGIPRVIGGTQGLRHHPAVINKIARVTFMPKSGNKDTI